MSTLLNIIAGYFIEYASWIYVFFVFGIMLTVSTILIVNFVINDLGDDILHASRGISSSTASVLSKTDVVSTNEYTVKDILTDWRSVVILFVSFWMTFRSRSMYVVVSSLWMEDVFNLSASGVGWTNIAIIAGEILAPLVGARYLSRMELKKSAFLTLSSQMGVTCGLMLVLSLVFGNDCGSIVIVLIIIVLLTFTHQAFYIVQQSNAIEFAKSQEYSFMLLLGERMCQETGSIVSLLITSRLWYDDLNDSVMIFSIVWSFANVIMFTIMYIYN